MRPTRGNLAPPPSPRHATTGHKGTKPARRDTYRVSTCPLPGAPRPRPQQSPPSRRCWSRVPCRQFSCTLRYGTPDAITRKDLPGAAVQRQACDGRAFYQTLRRHPQSKTCIHRGVHRSTKSQNAPQTTERSHRVLEHTSAADGVRDARPPLAPTASRDHLAVQSEAQPTGTKVAVIEKTRNKARIHLNLILGAFTLIGAFAAATLGRRRREQGESLTQMNLDWHEKQKGS
ncbi:hypothetical protein HPB51_015929 [Rhipicephalus microplus]|uniref:Uncharacterized protein n=1 Tax=Rhipicephalus microplus TaxID=6941 RepID=A0A9J6DH99_RHIMP|nr:hypothetical protein HPB51_015929 [Rhipicephalus microplus]